MAIRDPSRPAVAAAFIVLIVGLSVFVLSAAQSRTLQPRAVTAQPPLSWTQGYSLIVLADDNVHAVSAAVRAVRAAGGTVAVSDGSRVLLGWIPPDKAGALLAEPGIVSIHFTPVDPDILPVGDEPGRLFIRFFDSVVVGEADRIQTAPRAEGPPLVEDALAHPFADPAAVTRNLAPFHIPWDAEAERTAANGGIFPGYSDILEGSIAVGLLFVESNGSIDPDTYTWTASARDEVLNQVLSGASWWSSKARTYGRSATFSIVAYDPTQAVMQQGYEPINHSSSEDGLWISAVMANLGFSSGDKFSRTTAFDAWLKNSRGAEWAYTSVFCYNPSPAPTRFTDNYFAYSYLGGPYNHLLYRNDGWAVSDIWKIFAHETGHIFWACDEYYQAGYGGCTSCAPCNTFRPRPNNNCEHPSCNPLNSVPCIMRANSDAVCPYTAAQIGWDVVNNTLVLQAGPGGTTIPAPGSYVYQTGTSVTVTASPYPTYIFYGWTDSLKSSYNPLTFIISGDWTLMANFRLIQPPANLTGTRVLNRSLARAEYIDVLGWAANPDNAGLNIVGYRIYLVSGGARILLEELDAQTLSYRRRKISAASAATYEVAALLDTLREGKPASVMIE